MIIAAIVASYIILGFVYYKIMMKHFLYFKIGIDSIWCGSNGKFYISDIEKTYDTAYRLQKKKKLSLDEIQELNVTLAKLEEYWFYIYKTIILKSIFFPVVIPTQSFMFFTIWGFDGIFNCGERIGDCIRRLLEKKTSNPYRDAPESK